MNKAMNGTSKEEKIARLLSRNVEEVIERPHLEEALRSGRKLRVKLGIDPTSPDLHLGHAVVLDKLREFQDLGHKVVFIIGDFTARIGDPSGKSKARPPLSLAEVKKNMRSYLAQAGMIIDIKKAEVRFNSGWLKPLKGDDFMRLLSQVSMQQVLEREDFAARIAANESLRLHEILYPVMQAYDSVMTKADVELGGNDQLLNLLAGRTLMGRMNMKPQDILTTSLLVGLDGTQKMSKSIGNYVGLTFVPNDMFGKVMSVPDSLIERYFMFCTDLEEDVVKQFAKTFSPRDLKARLAREVVKRYHGEKKAAQAEENFNKLFSRRDSAGADMPTLAVPTNFIPPVDLIVLADPTQSRGAARRLIEGGGLKLNDVPVKDATKALGLKVGDVLKVGKRHFFKLKTK